MESKFDDKFEFDSSCNFRRSLDYSDEFTEEEEDNFLLELTRQMSYSTVDNIICFKPPLTTKTYHLHQQHHPISFDQNNTSNYKGRGRISQTKARGPKQQMKQHQHIRKQQHRQDAAAAAVWGEKMNRQPTNEAIDCSEIAAGSTWRYPRHMQQQQQQGSYGIRRESTGTGVFLPRHHPDTRTTKTDVDAKVVGRGQSNTATTAAYALLSHHHQPNKKFHAEQPRATHHHHHDIIRLPEEWTY